MSSFEEPSSAESKPISSIPLDSTHEPSPEPQTPKERVIHPSEFPIKFEDYSLETLLVQKAYTSF